MNIIKLIRETIEEYRGEHEAPGPDDSPLHDLSDTYGEDIYSNHALKHFGHTGDNWIDNTTLNIIQAYRNKPKKPIKIYRAVPNFNKDEEKKLREIYSILSHHNKFGYFPLKNKKIYELTDKYPIEKYSYDEQQKNILNDLTKEAEKIKNKISGNRLKINPGDWVTINKDYAKYHGQNELNNNYKIITKTVPASTIYNEGNSIHEFGYNP